ncbi:hypothetical protein ACOSQ4_013113 [Xanthoceras sorbifolium]
MMKLPLLDMHTEAARKGGKPTFFAASKEGTFIFGKGPNEGPIRGRDYSSFMSDSDEEIVLSDSDDKDVPDKDAATKGSLMKKGIPSAGKDISKSSRQIDKGDSKALDIGIYIYIYIYIYIINNTYFNEIFGSLHFSFRVTLSLLINCYFYNHS